MAHGKVEKTNAARLLDRAKINYELVPYEVDEEHLAATGYIRGGCSPVGMKKRFPTYIHSSAGEHPFIYISAGVRGLQLKIAPAELIAFVGATVAEISREG